MKKEVVGKVGFRHRLPNPYQMDGKALVSFVVCDKDVKGAVLKAVDRLGGFGQAIKPRDRILLKPNFNSDDPPPGSTALDFLGAVIEFSREHGCTQISVGEGSGRPSVPSSRVFAKMGLAAN